jgi:hypothetical protein
MLRIETLGSLQYSEPARRPGASYKGGRRFPRAEKVRVIQAKPFERGRDAMPGSMMQRKSGLPAALLQQAW